MDFVFQGEAQHFQCLFLLGCHLAVLVPAVEHMTLVDVGCAFVQMQRPLLTVRSLTSGVTDSHGVTGGVYKTRERIHRGILIRDY